MNNKVVYLLGAGFSAPLGIPVVADFLGRARDLFAEDPRRFADFQEVFKLVRYLSYAKMSFKTDLNNIEEVLSLLELGEFAANRRDREQFVRFLANVVSATTPQAPNVGEDVGPNWDRVFLGEHEPWRGYAYFVAGLRALQFKWDRVRRVRRAVVLAPPARYSVISLNYDLVLETASSIIDGATDGSHASHPVTVTTTAPDAAQWPRIAKLHGSVSDNSIVPPTWNKGARNDISPAWHEALTALRGAQFIRVLGYSLPETDSYVRYLLKFAAAECEHLKGIDVVCKDPTGEVRARYESFVLVKMRFASVDLTQYLALLTQMALRESGNPTRAIDPVLEPAHEQFMAVHASA